jgi:large-conductance mechanosensitive channel
MTAVIEFVLIFFTLFLTVMSYSSWKDNHNADSLSHHLNEKQIKIINGFPLSVIILGYFSGNKLTL